MRTNSVFLSALRGNESPILDPRTWELAGQKSIRPQPDPRGSPGRGRQGWGATTENGSLCTER